MAEPLIQDDAQGGLSTLDPRKRVVFLVWCFAGQVDNGGFAQFLFNSTGEYATETVEALSEAGCTVSARLLKEAIGLFPDGVPSDMTRRNEALAAMPSALEAKWNSLDNAYFEQESKHVLGRLDHYWKHGAA